MEIYSDKGYYERLNNARKRYHGKDTKKNSKSLKRKALVAIVIGI